MGSSYGGGYIALRWAPCTAGRDGISTAVAEIGRARTTMEAGAGGGGASDTVHAADRDSGVGTAAYKSCVLTA